MPLYRKGVALFWCCCKSSIQCENILFPCEVVSSVSTEKISLIWWLSKCQETGAWDRGAQPHPFLTDCLCSYFSKNLKYWPPNLTSSDGLGSSQTAPPTATATSSAGLHGALQFCTLPLLKAQMNISGEVISFAAHYLDSWHSILYLVFSLKLGKRCPGICQSPTPGQSPTGQLLTAKWRSWWQEAPGNLRNQLVRRICWNLRTSFRIFPCGKSQKCTGIHSNPEILPTPQENFEKEFLSLFIKCVYLSHVLRASHCARSRGEIITKSRFGRAPSIMSSGIKVTAGYHGNP